MGGYRRADPAAEVQITPAFRPGALRARRLVMRPIVSGAANAGLVAAGLPRLATLPVIASGIIRSLIFAWGR